MLNQTVLKNRVRELRRRLKLRQSDVAEEIGVTRQTILAIEKGRLNPSTGIALRISRVLREPVDYVFFLVSEDSASDGTTEPEISNSSIPETAGAVLDLV
jgi:putative transcriptional regulator